MGHKNPNPPTIDQPSTRKARRTSSHKSSSSVCSSSVCRTSSPTPSYSTCSSPAWSVPEPDQRTTQSAKVVEASGWTPINSGHQTDSQRASVPSSAAAQRTKDATQSIPPVKKHRKIAPAPAKPPYAPPPQKVESISNKNSDLKLGIAKFDPLPKYTTSVFPVTEPSPGPTQQCTPEVPKYPDPRPPTQQCTLKVPKHPNPRPPIQQCTPEVPKHPEPRPPFDPSKCTWCALRDVAFAMDNRIELSAQELCALLRFRYARDDKQMERVGRCDIVAMREFCDRRGKIWYEVEARELIRKEMQRDLKDLADVGQRAVREGL